MLTVGAGLENGFEKNVGFLVFFKLKTRIIFWMFVMPQSQILELHTGDMFSNIYISQGNEAKT